MTGRELQSRIVRAAEGRFDRRVAAYQAEGLDRAAACQRALEDVLKALAEALERCRQAGVFTTGAGFLEGEIPDNTMAQLKAQRAGAA